MVKAAEGICACWSACRVVGAYPHVELNGQMVVLPPKAGASTLRSNKITWMKATSIQSPRAPTSQRPCRRVSDPLRTSGRSKVLVELHCTFIDAPSCSLHENGRPLQAQLSCLVSYHMSVS